jgi:hypothetical protein
MAVKGTNGFVVGRPPARSQIFPHHTREHRIVESTGWSCRACLVDDRLDLAMPEAMIGIPRELQLDFAPSHS